MPLVVHNVLTIDPKRLDEFRAFVDPDSTRRFPGCKSFTILEDLDTPGRVLFIQEWESRDALEEYRAWRTQTGSRADLRQLYLQPAVTTYCRHFER
jgi:quinol monooxygenase YgiN